jgi:hypothetical protein
MQTHNSHALKKELGQVVDASGPKMGKNHPLSPRGYRFDNHGPVSSRVVIGNPTLLNISSANKASPPCIPSLVVRVKVSMAIADQKSRTSYLIKELKNRVNRRAQSHCAFKCMN